jgi:hypothetical protein
MLGPVIEEISGEVKMLRLLKLMLMKLRNYLVNTAFPVFLPLCSSRTVR